MSKTKIMHLFLLRKLWNSKLTLSSEIKYAFNICEANPFINSAIAYIDEHYAENISLSYLANAAFMSESYFCVMFKRQTGTNVVNYINSVRIKNAKILLRTTHMSTNDIAVATGFQNVRYFYKKFKEFTGYTRQWLPHNKFRYLAIPGR